MAAATGVLVTIAVSLASGILKEASKKAATAVSQSSTAAGLKSAIFGGFEAGLVRLKKELDLLDSVLCSAQSIDPMQCDKNNLMLIWLRDVKDAACYADNLLDEIAYEKIRTKVQNLTCPFAFRFRIARKIKKFESLTAKIQKEAETTLNLAKLAEKASIASYQPPPTAISGNLREIRENPDTTIVLGRQADEELIVTKLCNSSPNKDQDLPVVAIVGRSGVGKTTLARMVFGNKSVGEHFGKNAWIFVSDHFKLERFLDEMLQCVTGQSHNLSNKGAMEDKLQESLKGEKEEFLLVLDDVWNTDELLWKSVESSLVRVTRSTGCRVLVTTQSFDVARIMNASQIHELEDLGDADARELFMKIAFANKTEEQKSGLEDVGERILSKCKGLPLAIKTMGALLGSMNDRRQWESVERSEIWGLSLDQPNVIMPWLLISFHHLPNAAIKQCFVHCSIVIEKGTFVSPSELIHAWMAQGFIQSTGQCSMEDVAQTYVATLVANGLLKVDNNSYHGRNLWMHDLVRDLACFISRDTCLIVTEAYDLQNASEVEHLQIFGQDTLKSQYHLPKGKTLSKLRTIICTEASLSINFAAQGRFLRDLRLIDCGLEKIPSSIEGLKHLRYFSLRNNPLKYLSESIGRLLNLQTIDLRECDELVELPREITMLVNLRHILSSEFRNIKMPKGMGQLTCLRTLPAIQLEENEGFEIKELGSLPLLSGRVEIEGLQHICRKEDVAEACLKTKEGVKDLMLRWAFYGHEDKARRISHDEEIMDGLHPHSNLESISVSYFGGKRISSWLPDMKILKTVSLYFCWQCEQLPTLGQLCFLESIEIEGMAGLEVIGIEFYHKENGREVASTSGSHNDTSRRRIIFPRLKSLCLRHMKKLREWVQPSASTYELFPCLEKLVIMNCPLLVSAPTCFQSLSSLLLEGIKSAEPLMMILTNKSNLTRLDISVVEQLTSLSHLLLKYTCLKTISISSCKELGELWPTPTPQCMGSLEELEVQDCDTLTSFPDIEGLSLLRRLTIKWCKNLSTLGGLERCVSIEELELSGNTKLELIPDLTNLSRLTTLTVTDFSRQMSIPGWLESHLPSLQDLTIGGFSEEIDQLVGARHLPKCLKELTLCGWAQLNSLPSELQFFNQLEYLIIRGYDGIERLPEWLGELSSLRGLYIDDCKKLKYMPPLDAMQRLTHLETLFIGQECPLLKERCREDGGEEWHKISHISHRRSIR